MPKYNGRDVTLHQDLSKPVELDMVRITHADGTTESVKASEVMISLHEAHKLFYAKPEAVKPVEAVPAKPTAVKATEPVDHKAM